MNDELWIMNYTSTKKHLTGTEIKTLCTLKANRRYFAQLARVEEQQALLSLLWSKCFCKHYFHTSAAVRTIERFEGDAIAFAFVFPFFAWGDCEQREGTSGEEKIRKNLFGGFKSKRQILW